MSVLWTPVAVGVPFAKAEEMQKRLEGAGIAFLPTEATSWIGKLRAFVDNAPDMSLFVDKGEVDRAKSLIAGILDPKATEQSVESYIASLNIEQLKRLLASTGWPDLVLDPAKKALRLLSLPPEPIPEHSVRLPLIMGALALLLGPLGAWISNEYMPRAVPWDDKMVPVFDDETRARALRLVIWGKRAFVVWFVTLFVVKCFR